MATPNSVPVVRDYVLNPQKRIRDRRTEATTADIAAFLDGDIDDVIAGVIRYRAEKRKANGHKNAFTYSPDVKKR